MNSLEALNQHWFSAINATPTTPRAIIEIAIFFADWLILAIPIFLIFQWCWGDTGRRSSLLKSCAVCFMALAVNQVIIIFWSHPRPFALGLGHTFINHVADPSFPSDHATVFSAIGVALLFDNLRSRVAWIILGLGCVVAWARVFLGVHFPIDMLGGLIVATIVTMIFQPVWKRLDTSVTGFILIIYRIVLAPLINRGWVKN